MGKRRRRANFTAPQKVAILRQHLLEHVAVSDLCDEHGLQPSQLYTWQKQFFEQGGKAFEGGTQWQRRPPVAAPDRGADG